MLYIMYRWLYILYIEYRILFLSLDEGGGGGSSPWNALAFSSDKKTRAVKIFLYWHANPFYILYCQ